MRIPFGTLTITDKTRQLVNQCLDSGRVSSGRMVREFEKRFAELFGVTHAVAVSSDADTLALAVMHDFGAKRGDEVILPALSYVSTGHAVLHAGFTPVFVDIDPLTLNIDHRLIEAAITPRTRAIFPVHLMGKPAPMDEIRDVARQRGLLVIEDAAEAFGALYRGKKIGAISDLAAFSLYVAHIITTGEGGIILTDREDFAEVLRSLRAHGRACKCASCVSNLSSGYCDKRFSAPGGGDIRFRFERIGYSSKMNELEAALGLGSLHLFDAIVMVRHKNLMAMVHGFDEFSDYLWTFSENPDERIGPHAFPFVVQQNAPFSRDELLLHLEKKGVDGRTLFSSIPTQCGGFEHLGHQPGDFPHAEHIGRNGIHIGVHQDITPADIDWFLELVRDFIDKAEARRS